MKIKNINRMSMGNSLPLLYAPKKYPGIFPLFVNIKPISKNLTEFSIISLGTSDAGNLELRKTTYIFFKHFPKKLEPKPEPMKKPFYEHAASTPKRKKVPRKTYFMPQKEIPKSFTFNRSEPSKKREPIKHIKSPREILGVPKEATERDIRKAYFTLARQHHPDKGGNEVKFKEIQNAYEALTKK